MATITTTYIGNMLFESEIGSHRLTLDVPLTMGGHDRAVTPPQMFIVSLGACVAALIADYCRHHEIATTGLKVDVSFDKAEHSTRLENIRTTVRLPYADVQDKKRALEHVAQHCPVHETIVAMTHMDIEILDRSALANVEPAAP
jgi:uncharacterized OsmC-like protein